MATGKVRRRGVVLALVVGLLWIGPGMVAAGVAYRGTPYSWPDAVVAGLAFAALMALAPLAERRADLPITRRDVTVAIDRGAVPEGALHDVWRAALEHVRLQLTSNRVVVPVALLLLAGLFCWAEVRVQGTADVLWFHAGSAVAGAAPSWALTHRRVRRIDRMLTGLAA